MPPASEDLEPLSPELVLVADEESARRARERLPLPSFVAAAAPPAVEPPPAVVPEPQALLPDPPVPPAQRAPPVPYPRVVLDDLPPPPRRRRRRGLALVLGLVAAAALGGAGYVAATRWADTVDAPAAGVRAVQTVSVVAEPESSTTATPQQPPKTAEGTPSPAPHTAQPATTARARTPLPPPTTAPTPRASRQTVRSATVPSKQTTTRPPAATTAPSAAPTGSFVPGRQWIWAAAPDARGYEFTIYRGGQVVFRSRPAAARVQLPRSFRWQPGAYRWTVVALPPGGASIVDSSFELTAATAAAANRA